jgi:hypothetical protein
VIGELPVVLAPSSQINSTNYNQDIGPDKSGKNGTLERDKMADLRHCTHLPSLKHAAQTPGSKTHLW